MTKSREPPHKIATEQAFIGYDEYHAVAYYVNLEWWKGVNGVMVIVTVRVMKPCYRGWVKWACSTHTAPANA